MSELTPWSSRSVPERRLTADEREVILKHLYDRASLQAHDEKARMAVRFRVAQGMDAEAHVENAVTTSVERQAHVTNPDAQAFMHRYRAQSLMDMQSDVRAILRSSADVMDDIVHEPYTQAAVEPSLTLREFIFGRTDE
jgi:hypothetical protein